jgi:uncharacterized membrane protein
VIIEEPLDPEIYIFMNLNYIYAHYAECFKKSFKTLKAYINLFRGHVNCHNVAKHTRVVRGIVTVQCDFHWYAEGFKASFTMVFQIYCILASCYIRLTQNICSFVRQCNTFTS